MKVVSLAIDGLNEIRFRFIPRFPWCCCIISACHFVRARNVNTLNFNNSITPKYYIDSFVSFRCVFTRALHHCLFSTTQRTIFERTPKLLNKDIPVSMILLLFYFLFLSWFRLPFPRFLLLHHFRESFRRPGFSSYIECLWIFLNQVSLFSRQKHQRML